MFRFGVIPAEQTEGYQGGAVGMDMKNIDVAQYDGELLILRRWRDWRHIAMAVFAVVWLSGTAFFTLIGLLVRSWSMLFFMLFFFAAGVFVAYYALAGLQNRTTIWIGGGEIIVAHGLIPWPGNTRINSASIRQLMLKEVEKHNADTLNSTTYQLCAVTADGREVPLLRGMESVDETRYLEHLIAGYLQVGTLPMQQVYVR